MQPTISCVDDCQLDEKKPRKNRKRKKKKKSSIANDVSMVDVESELDARIIAWEKNLQEGSTDIWATAAKSPFLSDVKALLASQIGETT